MKLRGTPRSFFKLLSSGALVTLLSSQVLAANLASECYVLDDNKSLIQGENIDKKLPIASVSKLVTSYWSTLQVGLDFQFVTNIYVNATDQKDVYDVYIQGSRDPLFGKESLHYMISGLNKNGIKKVRHLYFDENFKFYWDVTSGKVAAAHYELESPSQSIVKDQMLKNGGWLAGYQQTQKSAANFGVKLVDRPSFSVASVDPVKRKDMNVSSSIQHFSLKSSQLVKLLKEMNRTSNNHAANQIFQRMGGADKFEGFIYDRLKLTPESIDFVNGSGDRHDLADGKSKYNSASCRAMIGILRDYRKVLRSQGKDLQSVMAVAGIGPSTLGRFVNDITTDALVAKTGFVSPARTLAGMISTQKGDVLFMYNFALNGTLNDKNEASNKIAQAVTKLVRQFGGPDVLHAKSVQFLSFDGSSFSEIPLEQSTRKN